MSGGKRLEKKELQQFVEKNIHYLREGKGYQLEREVEEFTNGNYAMYDTVYQALLEEGIRQGEVERLFILTDRMVKVKILKEAHVKKISKEEFATEKKELPEMWKEYTSPFITDNPEVLQVLLQSEYDKSAKPVIWQDGDKLYYMEATPKAAALAYGNKEILDLFLLG